MAGALRRSSSCGPTTLNKAKAAARNMAAGAWGGYYVGDPVAHLSGLQASLGKVSLNQS